MSRVVVAKAFTIGGLIGVRGGVSSIIDFAIHGNTVSFEWAYYILRHSFGWRVIREYGYLKYNGGSSMAIVVQKSERLLDYLLTSEVVVI